MSVFCLFVCFPLIYQQDFSSRLEELEVGGEVGRALVTPRRRGRIEAKEKKKKERRGEQKGAGGKKRKEKEERKWIA